MWHRLFGQDVTLWGPTHLMLIGGASLATLGGMVLMGEAVTTVGRDPDRESTPLIYHVRRALLVGGFLVALSTFQAEFDFGVPQFREVYQPILIMLAAGIGLVACRLYIGRGGALLAVAGYIVIRGFVTIMVGVVWGETLPHFPLYIVEALARRGGVRARRRPQPGRERRDRRSADRHGRPRRRVGLVAHLDADPLERLAAAGGRDRRDRHGRGRRHGRRLHRRLAGRRAAGRSSAARTAAGSSAPTGAPRSSPDSR